MGPTGWFLACLLCWIVAFPVYVIKRREHLLPVADGSERSSGHGAGSGSTANADFGAQLEALTEQSSRGQLSADEFRTQRFALAERVLEQTPQTDFMTRLNTLADLSRRCCTNPHWPARCPPTGSSPADAIRHWSAKGGHPIEDFAAEDYLTPLPGWAPGAKAIADDGLVAEERVLHPALTMVPGRLLPTAPTELLHQRDRPIPRGRPRAVRGDDGLTRGAADRVLDAAHDERRESDRDHQTGGDEPPRLEDLGAWREAGRNLDNIL